MSTEIKEEKRPAFDPKQSVSKIIFAYLDPEEQNLIWKGSSEMTVSEAVSEIPIERVLVYSAAMGWEDGVRRSIMLGCDIGYLCIAQAAAHVMGTTASLAGIKWRGLMPFERLREFNVYTKRLWDRKRQEEKKMFHGEHVSGANYDVSDVASAGEFAIFLAGSAAVGWVPGINMAYAACPESRKAMCTTALGTGLKKAARRGYLDAMQAVYDLGTKNSDSVEAALHAAACADMPDAMRLAVKMGAVGIDSALIRAASSNAVLAMATAVELGASAVNTALHEAASWNNVQAVREAIDMGADELDGAKDIAWNAGHNRVVECIERYQYEQQELEDAKRAAEDGDAEDGGEEDGDVVGPVSALAQAPGGPSWELPE